MKPCMCFSSGTRYIFIGAKNIANIVEKNKTHVLCPMRFLSVGLKAFEIIKRNGCCGYISEFMYSLSAMVFNTCQDY
jgi:hypothetical protein